MIDLNGCGWLLETGRYLQCDGVGKVGVLEEDGGLTGEGIDSIKQGVEWKERMAKQTF